MLSPNSSRRSVDISIIVMPFGPIFQPSLGASILRDSLEQSGLRTRVHYLSMRFLDVIGLSAYRKVSEYYPDSRKLVGEWLFSHVLYPAPFDRQSVEDYLELTQYRDTPDFHTVSELCASIEKARAGLQDFLHACADEILRSAPAVVGFTSMFQQHTASLALAKMLKTHSPETFVILGGANAEGPMGIETLRSFPWIDAVVSGPGEIALPLIARSLVDGNQLPSITGVNYQSAPGWIDGHAPEGPLDEIPPTHFHDFFEAYRASDVLRQCETEPSVLVETSRGCWWGQKHHCTFCGLNGAQMKFRLKSPARAISDLRGLSNAYPKSRVVVTDNIMPQSYYRDVVPFLNRHDFPSGMFFEIKANATEEQIGSLASAGVDIVQVGIENFSPSVLQHMRKGVSCLANIAVLKYCAMHKISASWILLTGFPCETEQDYTWNINVAKLIRHLEPPQICSEIRIDRFSPNHNSPSEFGFSSVKPIQSYSQIYRDPSIRLEDLAYFFEGTADVTQVAKTARVKLNETIASWQKDYPASELWVIGAGDEDIVVDARMGPKQCRIWYLDTDNTALLRASERKISLNALAKTAGKDMLPERVSALEELGVLFQEAGAVISLPLRLGKVQHGMSPALIGALLSFGVMLEERNRPSLQLSFSGEIRPGIRPLQRSLQ